MFRLLTKQVSILSAAAIGCSAGLIFMESRHHSVAAATSPFSYQVTREIRRNNGDYIDKKITLFQYYSCPFCCKVRAYLDLRGIDYDIVEVNSVFRREVSWSDYKKVPIVVISDKDGGKTNYFQINDSSIIISALESHLHDTKTELKTLLTYYPMMEMMDQRSGKMKMECPNRHAIMYGQSMGKEVYARQQREMKWRKWVDEEFVHFLSPNIYRTPREALAAFQYVSDVGDWENIFPAWQRHCVIYIGAFAMYFVGKIIAQRYGLDSDVRVSLYNGCRRWLRAIGQKPFMGGTEPDLSDLAVYGVLNSIEGCQAFKDTMDEIPKMASWYNRVQSMVKHSEGQPAIANKK